LTSRRNPEGGGRAVLEQLRGDVPPQLEHECRLSRRARRGPRAAVDQRELPKQPARPDRGEAEAAIAAHAAHLDRAADDDERRTGGVAVREEGRSPLERPERERAHKVAELLLAELGEAGQPAQQREFLDGRRAERRLSGRSASSGGHGAACRADPVGEDP